MQLNEGIWDDEINLIIWVGLSANASSVREKQKAIWHTEKGMWQQREIAVMWPEAKECQQPAASSSGKRQAMDSP